MRVGDIKKINKVYADRYEDATLEGIEVCILRTNGSIWPFKATVLSGKYMGARWLFSEDELA